MAYRLKGALTAVGPSAATTARAFFPERPAGMPRMFNLSTWGNFVGTYQIERCIDGTNWHPCTANGAPMIFSAPISEVLNEPDRGVFYRINVLTYTSGTLNYGFGP